MKIFRLKEVLASKGMSGRELAAFTGVTEATVSNLVKGEAIPRKDLLLSIAETLDVDIRDLFHSTKDIGNPDPVETLKQIRALIDNALER